MRLSNRLACAFAGLVVLSLCSLPTQAGITYVGVQTDIEPHNSNGSSGWRVAGLPPKLYATTPADIYGTAGYSLFGLSNTYTSLPGYVSNLTLDATVYPGNPGYASIDDPTSPGNSVQTGTLYQNGVTPGSLPTKMFSFVSSNPGVTRIGLLVDNADNSAGQPANQLQVSDGTNTTVALDQIPGDGAPDWYFFDIGGPGTYTIYEKNTTGGNLNALVGGISFDNVVTPEPTTALLLGIGAFGLLGRRSRVKVNVAV